MNLRFILIVLVGFFALPVFAENTALVPAPRDFPTNWMARHEAYVAQVKKGGIDLLFLGDSITDGWRWGNGGSKIWPKLYAPRHAANFGIGYDRIQNVLWRVENGELENISPKVVVLLIGTNNAGNEDNGRPRNTTPEIIEGISNLVRQIQVRLPQSKILLLGLFPRGEKNDPIRDQVKAVNAGIARLDDGDRVKFLDLGEKFLASDGTLSRNLFPDLLHPNARGFQDLVQRDGTHTVGNDEMIYGIERTAKGWEIAGVPQRVLDEFSKRTEQVELKAKELGVTTAKDKDGLVRITRSCLMRVLSRWLGCRNVPLRPPTSG